MKERRRSQGSPIDRSASGFLRIFTAKERAMKVSTILLVAAFAALVASGDASSRQLLQGAGLNLAEFETGIGS